MKILVITRDHITDFMGGTRFYANELNRYLSERRHEIIHICFNTETTGEFFYEGVKIVKIKKSTLPKPFFFIERLIKTRKFIHKYVTHFKPDVICFHGAETGQFLFLSGIPKNKLVYFVHAMNSHEILFDAKKNLKHSSFFKKIKILIRTSIYFCCMYLLEIICLKMSDRIITVSQFDQKEIIEYHSNIYSSKITIIPIGVDLEKYSATEDKAILRKKLNISIKKNIFVTFRRLEPRMGLERLIEAFSQMKDIESSILYIGGKGSLKETLEEKISDLDIKQYVKLLGFIEEDKKISFLQCADFCIMPAEELEGFGILTLEALACNTPVIGTPIGGIPEVLNPLGQEFLTRDNSANAIREKLNWACSNRTELTITKKYRHFVEQIYDWHQIISQIENVLKSNSQDKI